MSRLRCNWKVSCVYKKYTPWLLADKQPVYLLNFVHCNEFWRTWEVNCNLPVSFFSLWNFDGLYWCRERESSLEESSRKSNHQMHYSTRLPGYSIKPVFRIKLKGNKVCKQKLWWLVPGGGGRIKNKEKFPKREIVLFSTTLSGCWIYIWHIQGNMTDTIWQILFPYR